MGIDEAIAKASTIMSAHRISPEDQVRIVHLLLDAGVERCLQEQEKLMRQKDELIAFAQSGLPN